MIDYKKLMVYNPTSYGIIRNKLGQKIEMLEHPLKGDESDIIVVCHELELAAYSGFFDTADMKASHGEYQPSFKNGKLYIGEFTA